MAEWRTPVFDRTMDDAKSLDRTSAVYQKGALNADDLNRIEDNFKYVMAKLRSDAIFIPHRLRNFTETVMKYVEKENSILPEGYIRLKYIESTGTQYIDANFLPNQDTRVVVDVQMVSENESLAANDIFGCRTSTTSKVYAVQWNTANNYFQHFYNNGYDNLDFGDFSVRQIIDTNKNILSINGTSHERTYAEFQCDYPLYIFCLNNAGTSSFFIIMRLYAGQIYDNDTLVRDYVPCKNASEVVGLYDLLNDTFYTNAGTGEFIAGPEVEPEISYELAEIKTTYTDWQEHNLPWLSEINRIRANHNALVRLFLVGLGFSEQAESNYLDYGEVNDWERIVFAGKTMFENMEKEYRYCGMEHSGGDRLL